VQHFALHPHSSIIIPESIRAGEIHQRMGVPGGARASHGGAV